eukprot:8725-Heterococcus_DN1.PRE.2
MCVQLSTPTQQYARVTAYFVRISVYIRLDFETYASGCATQCVRRAHHAATPMCNAILLRYVQIGTIDVPHFCSLLHMNEWRTHSRPNTDRLSAPKFKCKSVTHQQAQSSTAV